MNICDSLFLKAQMLVPAFDLGTLIASLVTKAKSYGSGFIIFLGIVMIVVASFKIGKGLMTQGKPNAQPINWFLCGGLILVGGAMAFGGLLLWQRFHNLSEVQLMI